MTHKNHFGVNVRLLKMFGNVHLNEKMSTCSRSITYCVLTGIFLQFISCAVDFFLNLNSIERLAVNVPINLVFATASYKIMNFIRHKDDIEKLLYDVECTINVHQVFFEKYLYKPSFAAKIAQKVDVYLVTYLILGNCGSIFWVFLPLVTGSGKLPFVGSWYPFDLSRYYVPTYIFQAYADFVGGSNIVITDILFAKVAALLYQQIDHLAHSLRYINKNRRPKKNTRLQNAITHGRLKKCIAHHQAILKCCQQLEKCITGIFMVQFLFSTLVICFVAFTVVSMKTYNGTFLNLLIYLALACVELFIYCWFGNELTEHGKKITRAAFESEWWTCDVKIRKALRFVMMQGGKPIVLRAGKVFNVSMYNFIRIMRESISYFMVLRQLSAQDLL